MKTVENVIKQRLQLQSTQRALEGEFRIYLSNVGELKSIIPNFNGWTHEKKAKFIITIGGKANYRDTQKYLLSLKD